MNNATTIMPKNVPARRRSPVVPVVAGVTGAAVILGVTGYFAATRLMAAPGGPEDVIPGHAFAALRLDMDPSLSQKASYLKLRDALPGQDEQDGDIKDVVCDAVLPLTDCETLKPALGDRFAFAAWPGQTEGEPHAATFLQVTDADKAKAAVEPAYPTAIVHEGYLVVDADTDTASAAAVPADIEAHGALADNTQYRDDLDTLDMDGVAHVWLDLDGGRDALRRQGTQAPSMTSTLGISALGSDVEDLQGSLVGALALKDDGLQLRLLGLDLGDLSEYPEAKPLQHLGDLPAGTWGAIGLSGIAETLADVIEQTGPTSVGSLEDALGLESPQELSALLGDELAVGVAGTSESDLAVQARLVGADRTVVQRAVDSLMSSEDAPALTVDESEGSVVVGFGQQRRGRLAEDPRFARALPGLADAQSAFFLDFAAMAKMTGEEQLNDLGFVGVTSAVDHDAARMEVAADWTLQ